VHDIQAINQETLLEPYSMKNLQDSREDLSRAGSKLFSKIDLTSGFWQMFLNPECRKYTAFTLLGIGQFKWNALPAGLIGATRAQERTGSNPLSVGTHQGSRTTTEDLGSVVYSAKKTWVEDQLSQVNVLLAGS
jgi:hypothetical protein